MNVRSNSGGGYTLLEMVAVVTIMGIVGLVASFVIIESMKIYTRTTPALHAEYQARLASERMKREIRAMRDTGSITVLTPTELAFVDDADAPVTFRLAGSDLYRNNDLLAQGLSSFGLTYWDGSGQATNQVGELHLVELDLTVQVGPAWHRARTAAFPRCIEP